MLKEKPVVEKRFLIIPYDDESIKRKAYIDYAETKEKAIKAALYHKETFNMLCVVRPA